MRLPVTCRPPTRRWRAPASSRRAMPGRSCSAASAPPHAATTPKRCASGTRLMAAQPAAFNLVAKPYATERASRRRSRRCSPQRCMSSTTRAPTMELLQTIASLQVEAASRDAQRCSRICATHPNLAAGAGAARRDRRPRRGAGRRGRCRRPCAEAIQPRREAFASLSLRRLRLRGRDTTSGSARVAWAGILTRRNGWRNCDGRLTTPRDRLAAARVLVVGDAMLDRYWFGAVDRISPEAPVPVVRVDARGRAARRRRQRRAQRAARSARRRRCSPSSATTSRRESCAPCSSARRRRRAWAATRSC